MLGGYGSWLFTTVAGLGRAPGSASWAVLDIRPPQVLPPSYNLSFASSTLDTALGVVEVAWRAHDSSQALCGLVSENAASPNGTSLTFSCQGGAFTRVAFASFGTPTGSACPYAIDRTCHSNRSAAVVAARCVGRSACSIPATDALFGDPCPGRHKYLAVQLLGPCSTPTFSLRARVPAGGSATVRVPIGTRAPNSVNVTESGAPVWVLGAFFPTDGITAASAAASYVSFTVGAGAWDFELFTAASESPNE